MVDKSKMEIHRAFREWQFHHTVAILQDAIQNDGPTGEPGNFENTSMRTDKLTEAIKKAEAANVMAEECHSLLLQAHHTRNIRDAVRNFWEGDGDRQAILQLCEKAIATDFVVSSEIEAILEDQHHHLIIEILTQALGLPGITGTVEKLSVDVKSVAALREALHIARQIPCGTTRAKDMIDAAQYILDIREARPSLPTVNCQLSTDN